ncbi:hypothetical protein Tco_1274659 [Tanacetum coccineum]
MVMVLGNIPILLGSFEGNFGDVAIASMCDEHLLGKWPYVELSALRFRVDIVEAENASLCATIRTMEAIETVTRNHERLARIEIERQLASVQESPTLMTERIRKIKDVSAQSVRGTSPYDTCFMIYVLACIGGL